MLAFATQPLVVLSAAIALFIARTILHARRLKTVAKDPDLAKVMMAGQSSNLLKSHEESLIQAKRETTGSLSEARRTLHDYTRDHKRRDQNKP